MTDLAGIAARTERVGMERDVDLVSLEDAEKKIEADQAVENPTEESAMESDIVDEVGEAIGLTYQDDEDLRAGAKEEERDQHRWELDPASAEDYADRMHQHEEEGPAGEVLHMTHRGHIPHRR